MFLYQSCKLFTFCSSSKNVVFSQQRVSKLIERTPKSEKDILIQNTRNIQMGNLNDDSNDDDDDNDYHLLKPMNE